jgi:hypothetical protein
MTVFATLLTLTASILPARPPARGLETLDAHALRDIGLYPDQVRERDCPATSPVRFAVCAGGLSSI